MNAISRLARGFTNDKLITLTPDGEGCQTYNVSCAMLCHASKYFRAVLHGGFKEASSNILTFPDFDEKILEGFVYWLAAGHLPRHDEFLSEARNVDPDKLAEYLLDWELLLIRLWIFGDQYMIPKLQNCAMSPLLNAMMHRPLAPRAVREIFERTANDAPLRRAAVTNITGDLTCGWYHADDVEELSQIPGLLVAAMEENRQCRGGLLYGCRCDILCGRVDQRLASFMVQV
ncbi:hypothetical protein Tdes44962_MAKER02131 [Teratosphaeria destructans]|uniref:BTB domain-containing protein n=1 Tax=Teratosphaeria destructans TaxID=418781 RepID=A0A9W7W3J5_9PEZI|nr:hypothetical protein Tdes44962_MAKER02131 [Teratosphaeria destructans]